VPPPFIPDTPCAVAPTPNDLAATRLCGAPPSAARAQAVATSRTRHGRRGFVGTAVDHAFAVHSLLVSADAFAEWFERLLGALAAYQDDVTQVTTLAEWRDMTEMMDVARMGGSARDAFGARKR